MSAEPQKFFVGLVDFFSVVMPGAMLTYLVGPDLLGLFEWRRPVAPNGVESWVAFLFVSYLLGHFIFLAGSLLLDPIFDRVRKATPEAPDRAEGGASRFWPWVARHALKKEADACVREAKAAKARHLVKLGADDAMNTFQWAKARLALGHPDALEIVNRAEAESKFFRSLVVVLAVLVPWSLFTQPAAAAIAVVLLLAASLWRFLELRGKATAQAYGFIVALEGIAGVAAAQAGASSAGTVSSIQPPPSTRDPS